MATGKPFMTTAQKIALCQEYTVIWSDFFKLFSEGLEHKKVLANEEKVFAQMVSLLAYRHYKLSEMMGEKLSNPDGILEVLCESASLQHLKELSEAQFSKLQVDWHTMFIALNKCLGKLISDLTPEQQAQITGFGAQTAVIKTPQAPDLPDESVPEMSAE